MERGPGGSEKLRGFVERQGDHIVAAGKARNRFHIPGHADVRDVRERLLCLRLSIYMAIWDCLNGAQLPGRTLYTEKMSSSSSTNTLLATRRGTVASFGQDEVAISSVLDAQHARKRKWRASVHRGTMVFPSLELLVN